MSSDSEIEIGELNAFQKSRFSLPNNSPKKASRISSLSNTASTKRTRRVGDEVIDLNAPEKISEPVNPVKIYKGPAQTGTLKSVDEFSTNDPFKYPSKSTSVMAPSIPENIVPQEPPLSQLGHLQQFDSQNSDEMSSEIEWNIPLGSSHHADNIVTNVLPTEKKHRVKFALEKDEKISNSARSVDKLRDSKRSQAKDYEEGQQEKRITHEQPTQRLRDYIASHPNLYFLKDQLEIFEQPVEEIILTASMTKDEQIRIESLKKYATNLTRKINIMIKELNLFENTEVPFDAEINVDQYWEVCAKEAEIKALSLRKSQLRDSIKHLNIEYNKNAHLAHQTAIKNQRLLDLRKRIHEAKQILKEVDMHTPHYEALKSQLDTANSTLISEKSRFDALEKETQTTDMQIVQRCIDNYKSCIDARNSKANLRKEFDDKCEAFDVEVMFKPSKDGNSTGYAVVVAKFMTIFLDLDSGSRKFHFSYPANAEPVYRIYTPLVQVVNQKISKCLQLWKRACEIHKTLASFFHLGPYEFSTIPETNSTKFIQWNLTGQERLCILLKGETVTLGDSVCDAIDLSHLREFFAKNEVKYQQGSDTYK